MKKFLLLFALFIVLGTTATFAETYSWVTSSGSTVFKNNSAELNNATWTFSTETTSPYFGADWSSKNDTWRGQQLGKGKAGVVPCTISTDYFNDKTISQIIINASAGEADKVSLLIKVGGVEFTCDNSTSVALTTTQTNYTFTGNANGTLEICYTGSTTKAVYWRSIEVTYADGVSIGWTAENASVYLNDENNNFPTFNNPDNLEVVFDSSDPNVATIDDAGNVTLVGTGSTTITALDENGEEYVYTLVVERKLDTIFDNNLLNNQGDFTIEDILVGEGLSAVWTTNSNGMTANGYVSGNAHEADSWLISPVIDLRYATETTLSFEHGVNYFTDIETAKTETSFNIREEGGDWETVTIPYPASLGNNFISSGEISLAQYEGKKIQLGFHYTSGATKSGRWQIKNVLVKGFVDAPTLPEGGLDFTTVDVEDSFTIAKDVESATITITGVHAESELYCKFTATPAANPEAAPRKVVDHTGYTKVERNVDGTHTVTVEKAGTLELYTYHPATDSKSEVKTIAISKADDTTAIDQIGTDFVEGEAEYFNLQGVKINPENAAPGLYIRRQDGKAAKVMVK